MVEEGCWNCYDVFIVDVYKVLCYVVFLSVISDNNIFVVVCKFFVSIFDGFVDIFCIVCSNFDDFF